MENLSVKCCEGELRAIDDALYVLGGKWKLKIIVALHSGTSRFNEIQRTVGISAKMLSQDLKELELNDIVNRKITNDRPVTVEYYLTDHSQNLDKVLEELSNFGQLHRDKMRNEVK